MGKEEEPTGDERLKDPSNPPLDRRDDVRLARSLGRPFLLTRSPPVGYFESKEVLLVQLCS